MEAAWGEVGGGVCPQPHRPLGYGRLKGGEGAGLVQSQEWSRIWPGLGVQCHEITALE